MARTTSNSVIGILLGDYDSRSTPSLTPFIDTATVIVDRVETCASSKGLALTEGELELIERWLAAHFYCQSDKPYTRKETDQASGEFAGKTGMYLESTLYGQTALKLDSSGCLDSINKRRRVGVTWMGRRPSE